jgi:plastocyanin
MSRLTLLPTAAALGSALLLAAACGGGENTAATEPAAPTDDTTTAPAATGGDTTTGTAQAAAQGVDPRRGGFEIALGEWALTPEAESIRPGRATFVITNRGTMPHGFEIEREDGDDSSGSGSNDDRGKVETRVLQPGESVSIELNLREGVYKLECNVDGHDDMGMEMLFEVKKGAPLATTKAAPASPQAGKAVAADIRGFVFEPATIQAKVGQEVTWTNHDPAPHTVTQESGGFDSGQLASGGKFAHTFHQPGEYHYLCALHPGMKGTVIVGR